MIVLALDTAEKREKIKSDMFISIVNIIIIYLFCSPINYEHLLKFTINTILLTGPDVIFRNVPSCEFERQHLPSVHESLLTNLYKQGPVKLKDTIWFKNIPHLQFLFLKATYSPPSRASA